MADNGGQTFSRVLPIPNNMQVIHEGAPLVKAASSGDDAGDLAVRGPSTCVRTRAVYEAGSRPSRPPEGAALTPSRDGACCGWSRVVS